jgi:hypothetical protein
VRGNPLKWLHPHMKQLLDRIQTARRRAGKPDVESLTVSAPGERDMVFR